MAQKNSECVKYGAAEQRVNELLYLWETETQEPWSQEWRLELSEPERELVASWDESWLKGLYGGEL